MRSRALEPEWRKFEHDVALLVSAFGYEVEVTPPSNDFGVDVIACKRGRRVVIQCKLLSRGRTGHAVIQNLSSARTLHDAQEAICVTTSSFTQSAVEVARKLSVNLVDADRLMALCREVGFTFPSLTYVELAGRTYPCSSKHIVIGRDPSANVVVKAGTVSRRHACFERSGGQLTMRDEGSRNGTLLNGVRITDQVTVNYGDVISFGDVTATLVLGKATA